MDVASGIDWEPLVEIDGEEYRHRDSSSDIRNSRLIATTYCLASKFEARFNRSSPGGVEETPSKNGED